MENTNKQMFQGDWKCSGCGTAITQLPFQPDPARVGGLTCLDCHKKKMDAKKEQQGERKMFQGDWKCGKCVSPITELPFQPDPARADQLTCRDCYMKSRG